MSRNPTPRSAATALLAGLAVLACSNAIGGGGGGVAVPLNVGGAEGSACNAGFLNEGCFTGTGKPQRMGCDATTGQ